MPAPFTAPPPSLSPARGRKPSAEHFQQPTGRFRMGRLHSPTRNLSPASHSPPARHWLLTSRPHSTSLPVNSPFPPTPPSNSTTPAVPPPKPSLWLPLPPPLSPTTAR